MFGNPPIIWKFPEGDPLEIYHPTWIWSRWKSAFAYLETSDWIIRNNANIANGLYDGVLPEGPLLIAAAIGGDNMMYVASVIQKEDLRHLERSRVGYYRVCWRVPGVYHSWQLNSAYAYLCMRIWTYPKLLIAVILVKFLAFIVQNFPIRNLPWEIFLLLIRVPFHYDWYRSTWLGKCYCSSKSPY